MELDVKIKADKINFYYDRTQSLKDISMDIYANKVTALIGPSGCGKSTFLRLLNRMNDLIPNTRVEGLLTIDGHNINDSRYDVVELRRSVGMVFQKPNPFPKTIYENIAYGLKVNGISDKAYIETRVIESLKKAAIWMRLKTAFIIVRLCFPEASSKGSA
jgi:phosphate transport system ATP-binding protein